MLMQIEDYKNNNNNSNNNNNNNSNDTEHDTALDDKIKRNDFVAKQNDNNRYFVRKDSLDPKREKISPPKMKRRMKDEQNNSKDHQHHHHHHQATDFSKKVLPEVHSECNCGSPKGGKVAPSNPQQTPARMETTVPRWKSKDDVDSRSPKKREKKEEKKKEREKERERERERKERTPMQVGLETKRRGPTGTPSSIDGEPIHMSWDEVMREAEMLGIPLKSKNKHPGDVETRSRHGKNFYSDGDDCSRRIGGGGRSAGDSPSVASSASSIDARQSDFKKAGKKSPRTFRGIMKLQNFFKKLELRHKSPCQCQSGRNQKIASRFSPKSFLKEVLLPQRIRDRIEVGEWECEECIKRCKYCRSVERTCLAARSATPASYDEDDDDDDDCNISMARSWQPETNFDQVSLPTKSSSLNRRQRTSTSYQGSSYSLSSKSRMTNFCSTSFDANSEISVPDCRTIGQDTKTEDKKFQYEINPHESLRELTNCLWYWGSLDREGSNEILRGREDGCYLLRNSSDGRYVLALSFRSQNATHHTGIEYLNGHYTFHERSPPVQFQQPSLDPPQDNVIKFIQRASDFSRSDSDRYYLQPRSGEDTVVPVKLWMALLRPLVSLKILALDTVVRCIGKPEFITDLPVTSTIKRQLKKRFKTKAV